MSHAHATLRPVPKPFETTPVRFPARRGFASRPIRRATGNETWPPLDRDPHDIAVVAVRLLAANGRLRSMIRRAARRAEVEPDVVGLLLLFSETNGWLRIIDLAELLGVGRATASRLAVRAEAAGLIDKLTNSVDGREVACRLSLAGREAVTNCLELLRPDAIAVLRPPDAMWAGHALELLQPSTKFELRTQNWGWRAGHRAGMPDE